MEENKENKQQEEIKEETKTVENKTEEVKDEKKKTENKTEEIKEKVENKAEEKKEGSFDTEKLKSETTNTVNQVKDAIKNVNIKQDSIETKDFVKNLFVKPVEEIKKVVEDNTGKTFKYAIIIIAIWTIIKLFRLCFSGVFKQTAGAAIWAIRSEERRVGKECRSRWSPYVKQRKEKIANNNDYSCNCSTNTCYYFSTYITY